MPELRNYTPYPNFRYYSRDRDDREFGVIIVKATHALAPSGRLLSAEEQAPMIFTDLCHGAVNLSSLWHPSDLVPNKPATDIVVNAVARTPDGTPSPSWTCGVSIHSGPSSLLNKRLTVTGPRQWIPKWKRKLDPDAARDWREHRKLFVGWELSAPEPIAELPLRYEYAYGGEIITGPDSDGKPTFDTDQRNPIGRGKIHREWTDHTIAVSAPQIEGEGEPIGEPYMEYKPESFGPIPPAWLPRRPLGGTYDQDWLENKWPAWPADYSFAYHNSAHPDLRIEPFLKGGERIVLENLSADPTRIEFDLPGERLFVDFVRENGAIESADMRLDTVFLDVAAERTRDWRIYSSWRLDFAADEFEEAVIRRVITAPSAMEVRMKLKQRVAA